MTALVKKRGEKHRKRQYRLRLSLRSYRRARWFFRNNIYRMDKAQNIEAEYRQQDVDPKLSTQTNSQEHAQWREQN